MPTKFTTGWGSFFIANQFTYNSGMNLAHKKSQQIAGGVGKSSKFAATDRFFGFVYAFPNPNLKALC